MKIVISFGAFFFVYSLVSGGGVGGCGGVGGGGGCGGVGNEGWLLGCGGNGRGGCRGVGSKFVMWTTPAQHPASPGSAAGDGLVVTVRYENTRGGVWVIGAFFGTYIAIQRREDYDEYS